MTKKNKLLGKFDLTGISAPAPTGKPVIEVGFEVDVNVILHLHRRQTRGSASWRNMINVAMGNEGKPEIEVSFEVNINGISTCRRQTRAPASRRR
ncbi:unnamed protein product [Urochloa humidicola]